MPALPTIPDEIDEALCAVADLADILAGVYSSAYERLVELPEVPLTDYYKELLNTASHMEFALKDLRTALMKHLPGESAITQ